MSGWCRKRTVRFAVAVEKTVEAATSTKRYDSKTSEKTYRRPVQKVYQCVTNDA